MSQFGLSPSLWGLSHTSLSHIPFSVLRLQRCMLPHACFSKQKQRFTAPHRFQLCNCCTIDPAIKPVRKCALLPLNSSLASTKLQKYPGFFPVPLLFHSLIYIQYNIHSLFMLIVLIFLSSNLQFPLVT